MKFLADQNVELAVIEGLRAAGHDVLAVREVSPRLPDEEVLALAVREARIVVTNDKDFGDLVYLRRQLASGVILMRLSDEGGPTKRDAVLAVVRELADQLVGKFAVVLDDRVRLRQL